MIPEAVIVIHAGYSPEMNGIRHVCRNFFAGTYYIVNISPEFHVCGSLVGVFVRTVCHGAVAVRHFLLFLAQRILPSICSHRRNCFSGVYFVFGDIEREGVGVRCRDFKVVPTAVKIITLEFKLSLHLGREHVHDLGYCHDLPVERGEGHPLCCRHVETDFGVHSLQGDIYRVGGVSS